MGDNRYIVLPKHKLCLQVPRIVQSTDDLEERAKQLDALEALTNNPVDTGELRLKDVTVRDLSILVNAYDIICSLEESIGVTGAFRLAKSWDKNAYLTSEYDTSTMTKLRKEGYKMICFEH